MMIINHVRILALVKEALDDARAHPGKMIPEGSHRADVAVQANVGLQMTCGSGSRVLETLKMTPSGSRVFAIGENA